MGFTGIWISPVTHQLEGETGYGEAYHGYWQQDLYKLNSHFGSADDLRELSEELHRRGMVCVGPLNITWDAIADPTFLNYPTYYPLIDAFKSTSGNISNLVNRINQVKSACLDSTVLGTFSENQDNPRFANYTADLSLAKNVITFTMLADGIPIIYAGQEQHYSGGNDPNNHEALWLSGYDTSAPLYRLIAQLNRIRSHAARQSPTYLTYKNRPIYSDSTTLAMRKGFNGYQVITVLSNLGSRGPKYVLSLGNTGYHSRQELVEVLTCTHVTVDDNGNIPVQMDQGLPRVFYPRGQFRGSGICNL
ncbi:hypothetical protein VTN77DRAFT_5197 [Rasamsonia byssochlamydoides]|uniref:uncharacterized protein n=1 Tax=Rasamsonia byssochlamydoides TaxID=89139 RepID=UPI0037429A1F